MTSDRHLRLSAGLRRDPLPRFDAAEALADVEPPRDRPRASDRGPGLPLGSSRSWGLRCDGASNREIAQQLVISENTTANLVRAILVKTGSPNRTRTAILAGLP